LVAFLVTILPIASSTNASAQPSVHVGAALTVPWGDFGDYANTGRLGVVGAIQPIGGAGVTLGGQAFYGQNTHEVEGERTNLLGAVLMASWSFTRWSRAGPVVFGGAGVVSRRHRSDPLPELNHNRSGMLLAGGLGYPFPLGRVSGFLAGAISQGFGGAESTMLIGVGAGVSFPLRGSGS
jgi:hypothetical protein